MAQSPEKLSEKRRNHDNFSPFHQRSCQKNDGIMTALDQSPEKLSEKQRNHDSFRPFTRKAVRKTKES
ncbi:hypothetical protein J7E35_16715 [Bacillus sp. ISL-45]|nr:hypothetical protein [Bacillus sp. ISL-45]